MKKTASIILSAALAFSTVGALAADASAEWVKSSSGYSYKDDETGKKLTGWQTISGGKYYFDKKGIALTGWKKINGDTYYFNAAKRGRAVTSWVKIGGKQYYFGSDGVMRTGWIKISGKTYYFGTDGVMRTGKRKINGKVYNFGRNGVLLGSSSIENDDDRIDYIMNGLEFGMTKKAVISAMPFETYASEDSMIIVELDDDDMVGMYAFDTDGLLCAYGYMGYEDDFDVEDACELFEEAEWTLLGSTDGAYVYYSPDYSSCGVAMQTDDEIVFAAVYSADMMDALMEGDTSIVDNWM